MKWVHKSIGAAILAMMPITALSAQTAFRGGTIYGLHLTDGGNFALRVKLTSNGADQLADCIDAMAYMNTDHSNYAAIAAMLMTDYVIQKPISIVVNKDSNNFCRLVYLYG